MDPRNPLFYASTFVDNNAAGLLPPTQSQMNTLVSAMTQACYGDVFQPDRCAVLSQMVGRVRTQDARQAAIVTGGRTAASATLASTAPPPTAVNVAAALAVLGTTSASLAVC